MYGGEHSFGFRTEKASAPGPETVASSIASSPGSVELIKKCSPGTTSFAEFHRPKSTEAGVAVIDPLEDAGSAKPEHPSSIATKTVLLNQDIQILSNHISICVVRSYPLEEGLSGPVRMLRFVPHDRDANLCSPVPFETFDRGSISNYEDKLAVARTLAGQAESGQTIGAGSGSTSFLAIHAIAERVAAGDLADVTLIPTSIEVQLTIANLGMRVGDLAAGAPAWLFDGADEVDPALNLIKGRGGALFREKMMFRATEDRRVIVDDSKRVEKLGSKFAIPVEVVPLALPVVMPRLAELGPTEIEIRKATGKDGPVITELGNVIVDCRFEGIDDDLEGQIKSITGVVESGLFQGYSPSLVST